MDPLSLTASIIAVVQMTLSIVDTCYQYKSTVSNSTKEVTRIIQQLNSLRSVLERLLEILENENAGSTRLSTLASLAKKNGPLEDCVRSLEDLKLRLQPKTGWGKIKGALAWPLKEEEERKVLRDLNDMKATLHFALDTDHAALALQMHCQIESLANVADSIKVDGQRREISKWLAAPNPYLSYNAARKRRGPSTGLWFLDSKDFTQWIRNDRSFLWLHGIPGCGKSVLCSTAIERLYSISCQNPSIAIAYFFFDFRNSGNGGVEGMICSLILQLFNQSPEIPPEVEVLRKQFGDHDNKPPLPHLMELLLALAQRFQSTYFVIDALDECEELDELLLALEGFQNRKLQCLHVMVFSRRLPEIVQFMASTAVDSLGIDAASISQDINLYIKQRLENDKRFSKWPREVELEIYNALRKGAHGMFRWVACQLDMLCNSLTLKSLRRDLRSLPTSLEETYDRILLRIPKNHRPYAVRILSFLSFTGRPVSIVEVAEMLAVDLESEPFPCFDPESRFADPRDILLMCSNLVIISIPSSHSVSYEEPYYYDDNTETIMRDDVREIRLAHLSVKDYLLSKQIESSPASEFRIDSASANQMIAQSCVAYLLSPALEDGPRRNQKSMLEDWPFLKYAAHYWAHHTIASGQLNPVLWNQMSHFFGTKALPNGGNYVGWINVLTPRSSRAYNTEPLYYAASFGMTEVVMKLLEEDTSINIDAKGGRYGSSALHVAVYRGHNEVAKLLIAAGANINDRNALGESLLFWAHLTNTADMRALLLNRGADFTERDRKQLRIR